jgi:hypothetical protein
LTGEAVRQGKLPRYGRFTFGRDCGLTYETLAH